MNTQEQEAHLTELETRVDRLRVLYEQYFLGFEKLEPTVPRKDVERRFAVLRKEQIRNTALRFRFNVVTQKYNTYAMHWMRICRQIEEGTYKRHVTRARQRFASVPPPDKAPAAKPSNEVTANEAHREVRAPASDPAFSFDDIDFDATFESSLVKADAALANAFAPPKLPSNTTDSAPRAPGLPPRPPLLRKVGPASGPTSAPKAPSPAAAPSVAPRPPAPQQPATQATPAPPLAPRPFSPAPSPPRVAPAPPRIAPAAQGPAPSPQGLPPAVRPAGPDPSRGPSQANPPEPLRPRPRPMIRPQAVEKPRTAPLPQPTERASSHEATPPSSKKA